MNVNMNMSGSWAGECGYRSGTRDVLDITHESDAGMISGQSELATGVGDKARCST